MGDFPVRIRIRWYGNIWGDPEVQEARRSEKSKKKNSGKSGFPESGYPDGSGTIRGPSGSQGESLDTHIVGPLSLKSRKNEKSGFSKNRISQSGSGLGVREHPGGDPEVPMGL